MFQVKKSYLGQFSILFAKKIGFLTVQRVLILLSVEMVPKVKQVNVINQFIF